MESELGAIIAVAGTLLGSSITYLFQRRSSDRAEAFAFRQQLRAERMTVYSDFAGAISDFRRGQQDRWHRANEHRDSSAAFDSRLEAYRLRSASLHALFRVQLVAADQILIEAARHAYELTSSINQAASETELGTLAVKARDQLQNFVENASRDVQLNRR